MKIKIPLLALLAIFWGFRAFAATDCKDLIASSEQSWVDCKYDESEQWLKQAESKCPALAEIYWRQARNLYDKVESLPRDQRPGKADSIKLYNRIIALSDKCISLAPNDGLCYHWKAVGIGRRGTTRGVLNSLGDLRELETTISKAESLKPNYRAVNGVGNAMGDIYDAHGMLYRVVPDWSILKLLFGARGDIAKSVEYQRKAVAAEPARIEYNKELGVSLVCYGQKQNDPAAVKEGLNYLKKVDALTVLKPSDKVDKQHAKLLLANPDMACGYSRDSQQVQSKEAFDQAQKNK